MRLKCKLYVPELAETSQTNCLSASFDMVSSCSLTLSLSPFLPLLLFSMELLNARRRQQPFTVSFIYLIGWTLLRKPPLAFLSSVSLWYILSSSPRSGSFLFILILTSEWKATLEIANGTNDKQISKQIVSFSRKIFVFEQQIAPQMQEKCLGHSCSASM